MFTTVHLYPGEAYLLGSRYYLWNLPLFLSPTKVPTWKPACLGLSVSQQVVRLGESWDGKGTGYQRIRLSTIRR